MSLTTAGARVRAGTGASGERVRLTAPGALEGGRPISPCAFAGVAVASFGGPLALAPLAAPGVVDDAADSAGLAMLAAAVVFTVPLAIWLRCSKHIASSGGLF